MNLLPRDGKFFEYFNQHANILCQSSELLVKGLHGGYQGMCSIEKQMEALERSGDEVIHEIFRRLQNTFITPFDPEDIQQLATALDDVLDSIEDATFRIVAYHLDPIPDAAVQLGRMIDASCKALSKALRALQNKQPAIDHLIEVNRLEDEADAIERTELSNLFATTHDPITLIKLKEVYEVLEGATDRCEDVSDVIQAVAVKNS